MGECRVGLNDGGYPGPLVLAGVSKLDVAVLLLNADFGNFAIQNNTGMMKTLSLLLLRLLGG